MPFYFGESPYHSCDCCESRYPKTDDICPVCGASYRDNEAYAEKVSVMELNCSNWNPFCSPGECINCMNQ